MLSFFWSLFFCKLFMFHSSAPFIVLKWFLTNKKHFQSLLAMLRGILRGFEAWEMKSGSNTLLSGTWKSLLTDETFLSSIQLIRAILKRSWYGFPIFKFPEEHIFAWTSSWIYSLLQWLHAIWLFYNTNNFH